MNLFVLVVRRLSYLALFTCFIHYPANAEILYPVTPNEINKQIEEHGIEVVYQELFSDQTAANMVLLAIDSGAEQWLDLATKFKSIEHPRTQSMLTMSVGEALQWSAKTIFGNELLLKKFPLKQICSVEGLYEWRRFSLFLVVTAIERRIQAVTAVQSFALQKTKAECLKLLKSSLIEVKSTMKNTVPTYP